NALEFLEECAPGTNAKRIGVLRTYVSRHGPGPLPTETEAFRAAVFDHNQDNQWQGTVRYGWFDAVLARYANDLVQGVDALAITHVDAISRMPTWQACCGYRLPLGVDDSSFVIDSAPNAVARRLALPASRSLARQARLGETLTRTECIYEECAPNE